MYKQTNRYDMMTGLVVGLSDTVIRLSDSATIPFDIGNVDYQAYLNWLNLGNQPIAADEVQL